VLLFNIRKFECQDTNPWQRGCKYVLEAKSYENNKIPLRKHPKTNHFDSKQRQQEFLTLFFEKPINIPYGNCT